MKTVISTYTFFLLLVGLSFSQSAEGLLQKLQDKFDKINDLSAEFVQSANGQAYMNGKFMFKKEDKLRIEFKNSTLISNGKTNWNFNKKENKVIISEYESNGPSPLSIKKIVYDYPKECSVSSATEDAVEILIFTPNQNSQIGYTTIRIWPSKDHLINKVEMKDKANNLFQVSFTKYKINQGISDNKFNFNPPEGSQVIDLR